MWVDKDVDVFNFLAHYSCLLFFLFSLYNQMTRSIIYTFIYILLHNIKTETFFSNFGLSSEKISWFLDENQNYWFITNLFFNAYSNDQFYRAHIPRGAQRPGGFQGQRRHASLLRPIRSRNAQRHLDEGRETPGSWRSKVCTVLVCECPRLVKNGIYICGAFVFFSSIIFYNLKFLIANNIGYDITKLYFLWYGKARGRLKTKTRSIHK